MASTSTFFNLLPTVKLSIPRNTWRNYCLEWLSAHKGTEQWGFPKRHPRKRKENPSLDVPWYSRPCCALWMGTEIPQCPERRSASNSFPSVVCAICVCPFRGQEESTILCPLTYFLFLCQVALHQLISSPTRGWNTLLVKKRYQMSLNLLVKSCQL